MATHEPLAIVMAAGKGTRMKTELPKVLVEVDARPMIDYVTEALRDGGVKRLLIVVGYRKELLESHFAGQADVTLVHQAEQLGTGHAVMVCRDELAGHDGAVVVVAGDSPMLQSDSVGKLLTEFRRRRPACILGTTHAHDPTGLGRIVRDADGEFQKIVEQKDATEQQRQITEVNMSTYLFDGPPLLEALSELGTDNAQGEYYITDCPGILKRQGRQVLALDVLQPCEALSINTIEQLQQVEAEMRSRP